ncbi:MAG: ComEA family DNA-binding protein [Lachnospiraceae bacterium]|nr:ComEA family DNA-binding protein [Lachnospiraceae bacterium]
MYGKKEKIRFTGWITLLLLSAFFAGLSGCGKEPSLILETLPVSGEAEGGRDGSQKEETGVKEKQNADDADGVGTREEGAAGDSANTQVETMAEMFQVHVCGAVKRPGVYMLPAGSRVFEALDAAGGATEDAAGDYLNLADMVSDGSKVRVPFLSELSKDEVYGEAGVFGAAGTGGPEENVSGFEEPVDLNSADKEALMTLPGIGEARAEAVISWREEHGGFGKPEDIMLVPGIKEAAYEKLKDKITVKTGKIK